MTRVDFYVLSDANADNRAKLVCKLAEKAFRHDKRVFIHSDDAQLLEQLDETLWEFRADSFVPHRVLNSNELPNQIDADPVQLSTGDPGNDRHVLINLASGVPPFFSRFERALEVVNQAETVRDAGRDRYRFYQQRGYPLHHHKM